MPDRYSRKLQSRIPAALPADFHPLDCSVNEAAAFLRCGLWTIHKLVRDGAVESYRLGHRRKIVFASLRAYRDRAFAAGVGVPPTKPPRPTAKRKRGRPRAGLAAE